MTRRVAFLCGALLALATLGLAPSATAEDGTPTLRPEDWPLLPINRLEQQELARDHPELVRQITTLAARLKKLEGHRRARANPDDEGGRGIGRQSEALRQRLTPLVTKALAALDDESIDARLLEHIARAPRGPHREARYAAGLALFVEDVPSEARALVRHILPRMDGARLLLDPQENALHLRHMEKRYWRLIDYVLPATARIAIHRRLPTAYQQPESTLEHLYALPGLTPSQGTRLRAVLEEVQAQSSPDNALIKRLQTGLTTSEDRRGDQKKILAARDRLVELQRWAADQAKEILTAEQWRQFEAIPPRVSIGDRRETSVQLLRDVRLGRAQREKLTAMRAELADYRAAFRTRRAKAAGAMSGMGPDSPQMAGAQMALATVQAEANVVQRRFNGRVLLELLTPDQVARWVIAPPAKSR